ncbi:MAG: hypothetical protein WBE87_01720, partial [Candidatus Acidiferrales bacterium]
PKARLGGQGRPYKNKKQIPHRYPAKAAGWVRDDNEKQSGRQARRMLVASSPAAAGKLGMTAAGGAARDDSVRGLI